MVDGFLITAGGATKDNPYRNWCNVNDCQGWQAQVEHVRMLVNAAVRDAWQKDSARAERELQAQLREYTTEMSGLKECSEWMAFGFAGCARAVGKMIAAIESGACVFEKARSISTNVAAPSPGTPPPPPMFGVGGDWMDTIVMLVGAFLVVQLVTAD